MSKFIITRRHGTIAKSGTSITVAIKQELLGLGLNEGDQVAISLLEVEKTKEKQIVIEKP